MNCATSPRARIQSYYFQSIKIQTKLYTVNLLSHLRESTITLCLISRQSRKKLKTNLNQSEAFSFASRGGKRINQPKYPWHIPERLIQPLHQLNLHVSLFASATTPRNILWKSPPHNWKDLLSFIRDVYPNRASRRRNSSGFEYPQGLIVRVSPYRVTVLTSS